MRRSNNIIPKLFGAVCVILLLIIGVIFTLPAIATVDNSSFVDTPFENTYNWTTDLTSGTYNLFPVIVIILGVGIIVSVLIFAVKQIT